LLESSPNDSAIYYSNYGNRDANVLQQSELGVGLADVTASFAGFSAPIGGGGGGGGGGDGGAAAVANSAGALRLLQQERAQERSVVSSNQTGSLQMAAMRSTQQQLSQLHSQQPQSMDAPAASNPVLDSVTPILSQLHQSPSEAAAQASTRPNSVSPSSASAMTAAGNGSDVVTVLNHRRVHVVHSHNNSSTVLDHQRSTSAAAAATVTSISFTPSSVPIAAAAAAAASTTTGVDEPSPSVANVCVTPSVTELLGLAAGGGGGGGGGADVAAAAAAAAAADRLSPATGAFVPHASPADEQTVLLHHYTASAQQQHQQQSSSSPQPFHTNALAAASPEEV
jgi:hypothetical protein